MRRHYRNYTDQDITLAVANSVCMSEALIKLGLKAVGGNFINMKRNLQRLDLDTSHWTGQAWSKDKQLKDYSQYTNVNHLKKHLINERGSMCELCRNEFWLDVPISLEVHHEDGDRTNNEESNLQLLCPNCHSMTKGWRGRK